MSSVSQKTGYGLMALYAMAEVSQVVQSRSIAERYGIPHAYLEQVLVILRKSGLCQSTRGKHGGYQLARPSASIQIGDVIQALEGNPQYGYNKHHMINDLDNRLQAAITPVLSETLAQWVQRYQSGLVYAI